MRVFTSEAAFGGGGSGRIKKENQAGEKEQTSREDGPVELQEEKNHVIYLGLALEGSRLEHGRLDCGTYVLTFGYIFGTNVIENIDYIYV